MADDTKKETLSKIEQIIKNVSGEGFSQSLNTLVDIWTKEGKSEQEIKDLLNAFQKREQERLAQMQQLRTKVDEINKQIEGNESLLRKSREIVAQIDLQIATLNGRLAEREQSLQELKQRVDDRQKEVDRLKKEIGI